MFERFDLDVNITSGPGLPTICMADSSIGPRIFSMSQGESDTAVILIAHGSRRDEANADLFQLVERLRATTPTGLIEPAFLELAQPDIDRAAKACLAGGARRVLLVPYFLSLGVHLTRDLSNARDRLESAHPGVHFALAPPLGPHPLLDELVSIRIRQIRERPSPLTPAE